MTTLWDIFSPKKILGIFIVTSWMFISVSCQKGLNITSGETGSSTKDTAGNTLPEKDAVSAPLFSPPSGNYGSDTNVVLNSANVDDTFFYTTDGSTPSETSTPYTAPILISGNGTSQTIKAIAIRAGITSEVSSANYTITYGTTSQPAFSEGTGTYTSARNITITLTTPGSLAFYTLDGTIPNCLTGSSKIGLPYPSTGGISIPGAAVTTLKAIACATGMLPSEVSSATYTVTGTVADPVFPDIVASTQGNITSLHVDISTSTPGASIRYTTDGTVPTPTVGTVYPAGGFNVTSTSTVKAIAYKADWISSAVVSRVYTIPSSVGAPQFSVAGGSYSSAQTVVITSSTAGANFFYTTDSNINPLECGMGTAGNSVTLPENATTTLRAVACKSGMNSSSSSAEYMITGTVLGPKFSIKPGTYSTPQNVILTSDTPDAVIRFTTDGGNPTGTSPLYTAPIPVSNSLTIRAIALKPGWTTSPITQATYNITGTLPIPVFSPTPGIYTVGKTVTISNSVATSTIVVTTNGSTPVCPTTFSGISSKTVSLVSPSTTTIKAISCASGWTTSPLLTGVYTITGTVATPTFSPLAGSFNTAPTVSISTTTSGATIRYTLDGSTPTPTTGLIYSNPFVLSAPSTNIKAIAYRASWTNSSIASGVFNITSVAEAPIFSPPPGTYYNTQSVTLQSKTPGVTFRYSINGSDVTCSNGTIGAGPISVSSSKNIKAVACKTGMADSPMSFGPYIIKKESDRAVQYLLTE